jgi:peptidoglycan/LPS O-acetylase OafA/YrhL
MPQPRAAENVWLTTAATLPPLLLVSWLLYRFIEAPMVRIGKQFTKRNTV